MNRDSSPGPAVDDALFDLELKIARRADEIARERDSGSPFNLDCWLLAESEVFGGHPSLN